MRKKNSKTVKINLSCIRRIREKSNRIYSFNNVLVEKDFDFQHPGKGSLFKEKWEVIRTVILSEIQKNKNLLCVEDLAFFINVPNWNQGFFSNS